MQTKLSLWLSLIALLAVFTCEAAAQGLAGAPVAPASGQLPGTIRATRVEGEVKYVEIATGAEKPLKDDMVIGQGTIVRTGANAKVVLLFSSGASINLAHTSELNIETFTQDPFAENATNYAVAKETEEPSVSTTAITLTQGELIGNVKKLKRGGAVESKFTVKTPVGAAGIRGTTFKVTYRPSGDGRTFTFSLTTLQGDVVVTLATGTVNAPAAGVSVTDSKEIVLTNVEVNPVTNQITATTSTGQTAAVTAPPPPVDAPVTVVAQVTAVAQQLVQAVANVVFTTPPPAPVNPTPTPTGTPTPTPPPTSDPTPTPTPPPPPPPTPTPTPPPPPSPTPGPTTPTPRITGP